MQNTQNGRPVLEVNGRTIICEGKWLRIARIQDEIWLERASQLHPDSLLAALRQSPLKADLFTFAQALPETKPKFAFQHDWDNLAVAPPQKFKEWWESLPQESRKNVRRSQRRGVTVRVAEFNDEFVRGIKEIYDETPVRQGRLFWHYRKDLEAVEKENGTYLDRSQFIGAYHGEELIGFIKLVQVDTTARIMQIISKNAHYDKRPTNSLLTKAMELCAERGITELIYGQYIYGPKASSSVTEFKRRNGFTEVLLPRYYVPLTLRGKLALSLGLHRGFKNALPEPILNFLLEQRTRYYNRKYGSTSSNAMESKAGDASEAAASQA